jgi:hypothetical protein
MKLRGNNILFFSLELISGILIYFLTLEFGDWGLLGGVLFFIGLIITRNNPDEREVVLLYKVSALEAAALGAIMAVIYLKFPEYNWFHGFFAFACISRGIFGLIFFLKE